MRDAHPYEEPAYDVYELEAGSAEPTRGHGRIGELATPVSLQAFAEQVAGALPTTAHGVRVAGDPDREIRTVAVGAGAGDSLLELVGRSGADVYVTSDLRHHRAGEFLELEGPALVDVAHWAAEWTWLPVAEERVVAGLAERGYTVDTRVSTLVTDPWTFRAESRLDTLRHQLSTLPEHAELSALAVSRDELDNAAKDIALKVDDLTREQKKADADVEQVKARRKRDQDRMDQGLVSNPKDLEHLSHELVSLDRRISELEDVELEVMEQLETAQSELTSLRDQLTTIEEKAQGLLASRDEKAAAIRTEAESVGSERKTTASGVPADLIALYEKLRESKSGVGAAPLRQKRCGGCGLELSPADLAVIKGKPVDEVVRCEECSRILVRTAESGL
jgi:predicted  nucleic acid-binding Zn-ribbon protein